MKSRKPSILVVDPRGYTPPYDYSLCNALAEQECEVLLACTEHGQVKWNLKAVFPIWDRFYHTTPTHTPKRMLAQGMDHILGMRRFVEMAESRRPDVIHFQWLPLPVVDQLYVGRLKRRSKLVLTLHNTTTLLHGVTSRWRELGFVNTLKAFDGLIVHTEFSKQRVLARGWADEDNVHVVPHGAFHYHKTVERAQPIRTAKNILLFFGTLHPYKGVDVLLHAFARLAPGIAKNTRLIIAGRPEMDVEPLYQLSRELKIDDRVDWILRPIGEEEIPVLFGAATAVVLPYREIDQSGVLMTAIAFSKPILATRVGGIPETIQHGVHGYLVPPENAEALSAAAGRLLACEQSRQRMEIAVRELGNGKLSWSSIASQTLDLYRQLIEKRYLLRPATVCTSQANEPALN